jgi:hypothetical protein
MPQDIPKVNCLVIDPPDDPIGNIIAVGKASGAIPPANQYFNTEVTYQCPAGYSGSPVTIPAGTYSSTVSVAAANATALAAAEAAAVCTLDVPGVLSGAQTVANNVPFTYQIVATGSPTSYGATGLPTGMSVNTSTGLISGTPTGMTTPSTINVTLSATNTAGTGYGTLTLTVIASYQILVAPGGGDTPFTTTEISVDGSAYTPITTITYIYPTSQFKVKSLIPASTTFASTYETNIQILGWTTLPTLTSGSVLTVATDVVTPSPNMHNLLTDSGTDYYYDSTPTTSSPGNVSSSVDVSGLNFALDGDTPTHVHSITSGGTASSTVMESIFNF